MKGLLPPNSSDSFLRLSAQFAARSFPTRVDPVKDNFLTSLLLQSASPTSFTRFSVVITLIAPLGKPASCANTACARQLNGVSPAGFYTVVQPAASAAPTFRVIMAMGKFHGARQAATPRGCLNVKMR